MIYTSKVTTKGTTTIPVEIRNKLGIKPGSSVTFKMDKVGRYYLDSALDISALHKLNQAILHRQKTSLKDYKSGDGFKSHVAKKYKNI